MNTELVWTAVSVAAALALLVGLLTWLRTRSLRTELSRTRAAAEELAERVAMLEAEQVRSTPAASPPRSVSHGAEDHAFVITHMGEHDHDAEPAAPAHVDTRVFVDIVARESVVKAMSLAHGVRRAMDPETRNRIRFEMRREVKRSRKGRRAEMKQAWREYQERQRAAGRPEEGAA